MDRVVKDTLLSMVTTVINYAEYRLEDTPARAEFIAALKQAYEQLIISDEQQ